VVEAEQWFPGKEIDGVFMGKQTADGKWVYPDEMPLFYDDEYGHRHIQHPSWAWIRTLEGGHVVSKGEYIITGIKGERYPCKPDVFEETYEKVNTD
jgi:hypothetical protein